LERDAGFVLFAPGAGASSASAWMQAWRRRLATLAPVETFDYEYMKNGRRLPDPAPRLIEAHRRALLAAQRLHEGSAVLMGKSMGSRIGCHVALNEPVAALVCFGYPLRAPGSGKLRDQVLLELGTPILFVQGSLDPLCPLSTLERVRQGMRCRHALHVVEDGDHSLNVTRGALARRGLTQAQVDEDVLAAVRGFLSQVVKAEAAPLPSSM
jgi:predicted alpha/beta-hydrolase family hydrolase